MNVQDLIDAGQFSLEDDQSSAATLYDGDSPYIGDNGYRFKSIDTPEMPSQSQKQQLNELAKRKQQDLVAKGKLNPNRIVNTVRLATPGEKAKLEAQLLEVDPEKTPMKGLGDTLTVFDDTRVQPEQVSTGVEARGEYNPYQNYDVHGRVLLDNPEFEKAMVESGYAVPAFSPDEELVSVGEKAQEESTGLWGTDRRSIQAVADKRGYLPEEPKEEPSFNPLRGFATGAATVAAKVGSLVGEGLETFGEWDEAYLEEEQKRLDKNYKGEEVPEWRKNMAKAIKNSGTAIQKLYTDAQRNGKLKEMTGYDSADVDNLALEVSDTIENEGYLPAFAKAVTDPRSLQMLVDSTPEMIALAVSVGGMAVVNANNNINIGEAQLGRDYTTEEKVKATAVSVVGTYLDRFGDKLALNGVNPAKQGLKTAISNAPADVKRALASTYGKSILKIGEAPLRLAGAAAVEGATEFGQTLAETAAQNPDVFKKGYTDEQIKEAKVAGVLGSAMGGQMATPRVAKDVVGASKDTVVSGARAVKEAVTPKKSEEEVKADKIVEKEVTASKDDIESKLKDVDATARVEPEKAATSLYKAALALDKLKEDETLSPKEIEAFEARIESRRLRIADNVAKKRAAVLEEQNPEAIQALGSDKDALNELETLLKAGNDVESESMTEALKSVAKAAGLKTEDVIAVRDRVVEEKAKLEEATKTLEEVEGEVVRGKKGYLTYYAGLKDAEQAGDKKVAKQYRAKLQGFRDSQQLKADRLRSGLKDYEQEARRRVTEHAKAKGLTVQEAAVDLGNSRNKILGRISYSSTSKPFEVNSVDVYKMIANGDRRGAYRTLDSIEDSLKAMDELVGGKKDTTEKDFTTEKVTVEDAKEVVRKRAAKEELTKEDEQLWANAIDDGVLEQASKEVAEELESAEESKPALPEVTKKWLDKRIVEGDSKEKVVQRVSNSNLPKEVKDAAIEYLGTVESKPKAEPAQEVKTETPKKAEEAKLVKEKTEKVEEKEPETKVSSDPQQDVAIIDEQVDDMKYRITSSEEEVASLQKELDEKFSYEKLDELKAARQGLRDARRELGVLQSNRREVISKTRTEKSEGLLANSAYPHAAEQYEVTGRAILTEWLTEETGRRLTKQKGRIRGALEKVLDSKLNNIALNESPFRVLMTNQNGKSVYSEEVLDAMTVVMAKYLGESYGSLRYNDDRQIESMLGLGVSTGSLPREVRNGLRGAGRFEGNEAAGLGRDIVKLLGIKAKKDADFDLQERLESDAGGTLIAVMEELGYVTRAEELDVPMIQYYEKVAKGNETAKKPERFDSRQKVPTIKMGNVKDWVAIAKRSEEFAKTVENEIGLEVRASRPRYRQKKKPTEHRTRNAEKWTELTAKQQEVLDKAENRPYEVNEAAVEALRGMWGSKVGEDGKLSEKQEATAKLFGWSDPEKAHVDLRPNVKAKNREVVESIENLLEFTEEAAGRDVYFDYFFSKNGRFFIDSAKINPQTDKLHRFVINAKEDRKVKLVTDENRDSFKVGVVQAFDGSKAIKWNVESDGTEEFVGDEVVRGLGAVDKQAQIDTILQFDKIMKNELVQKAVSDTTPENLLAVLDGVDHPSHAMQAILALKKYSETGNFYTEMTLETDAVTSGFILGMLTNPVTAWSKLKTWLAKGGVWFGGESYNSYGEWRADGRDSYETGAALATERLGDLVEEQKADWVTSLVGDIDRKFMKSPFMVFMYGAGVGSIKRAISTGQAEDVLKKLSSEKDVKNTALRLVEGLKAENSAYYKNAGRVLEKMINDSTVDDKIDEVKLAKAFRELSMDGKTVESKALKAGYTLVTRTVNKTYGTAVADAMSEEFAEITANRAAMNNAFVGMYGAFKHEFDKRVATAKGSKRKPSKVDIDGVLDDMMKEGKIPGIMTVEAENEYEKAPILKKERVKAGAGSQVQIKTRPQRTLHPLVYDIVANPTAGAVVNIHYLDGALIMKVIDDSIGTGVHDAYVMHVGRAVDTPKVYNKAVWELTQKFDMMDRIRSELQAAEKRVGSKVVQDAIWNNHVRAFGKPEVSKEEMYAETVGTLDSSVEIINENKKRMKTEGATIAHMAGPDGSTYSVEGESKGEKGTIDGIVNDIINRCD